MLCLDIELDISGGERRKIHNQYKNRGTNLEERAQGHLAHGSYHQHDSSMATEGCRGFASPEKRTICEAMDTA